MEGIKDFVTLEWGSLIGTFIGVALGGIITWLVSRRYYIKAAKELNEELAKLKKNNEVLAKYLNKQFGDKKAYIVVDMEGNSTGLRLVSEIELDFVVPEPKQQEESLEESLFENE